MSWEPTAPLQNLRIRSQIIERIRNFLSCRGIMEVETPLLCHHTNPDPYIESFELSYQNNIYYLQTSPEFAMKRLLAVGSGPIYQLCKAFRREEAGHYHNPEFTILEWYRTNFSHYELMTEVDDLLQVAIEAPSAEHITYQKLFENYLSINPHTASIKELEQCARSKQIDYAHNADKDSWLNLLLTHCIEPHIGLKKPLFIYDYPASQAALAKIRNNVAERFEVYFKGIELANGFHELSDATEQERRFIEQIHSRKSRQQTAPDVDHFLLDALRHGLPNCAGVALGIDRLIMLACNATQISEAIAFTIERA